MDFPGLTFTGPEADDGEILEAVGSDLRRFLVSVNGLIVYGGGLHIRGACTEPRWHSIRDAWHGRDAFHRHYGRVLPGDVPFAEDAVGDQWLLRDRLVHKLSAETGDMHDLGVTFTQFLAAIEASPVQALGLQPLLQFQSDGGRLEPGQLLNVYPPFCTKEAAHGVHLAAVPADERRNFLVELARNLPSEGQFRIEVR